MVVFSRLQQRGQQPFAHCAEFFDPVENEKPCVCTRRNVRVGGEGGRGDLAVS